MDKLKKIMLGLVITASFASCVIAVPTGRGYRGGRGAGYYGGGGGGRCGGGGGYHGGYRGGHGYRR